MKKYLALALAGCLSTFAANAEMSPAQQALAESAAKQFEPQLQELNKKLTETAMRYRVMEFLQYKREKDDEENAEPFAPLDQIESGQCGPVPCGPIVKAIKTICSKGCNLLTCNGGYSKGPKIASACKRLCPASEIKNCVAASEMGGGGSSRRSRR